MSVILNIRCAEPVNDNGADKTISSDLGLNDMMGL
jgi:hypothetical protein